MNQQNTGQNLFHEPVLKKEILACLFFSGVQTVFDGTLGLGGHAEAILSAYPSVKRYIACDLDRQHLSYAKKKLSTWQEKLSLHHKNFSELRSLLSQEEWTQPLVILLDLGLCSHHVDEAERGFSFAAEGPLCMTFDADQEENAARLLNSAEENELTRIFKEYGEEPQARKIARNIVAAREEKLLQTTAELREIIERSVHPKDRKKSVTRVFQAVRIEVNQELQHLEKVLSNALEIMRSGDRMGVISYHSLEDRMVKQVFLTGSKPITQATERNLHEVITPARFQLQSKKLILPTVQEVELNPRARSARLRIIECTA